jgi:hypothetical protein
MIFKKMNSDYVQKGAFNRGGRKRRRTSWVDASRTASPVVGTVEGAGILLWGLFRTLHHSGPPSLREDRGTENHFAGLFLNLRGKLSRDIAYWEI